MSGKSDGPILSVETAVAIVGERLDRLYFRPIGRRIHRHSSACKIKRCAGETAADCCPRGIRPTSSLIRPFEQFECAELAPFNMTAYVKRIAKHTVCTGETLLMAAALVDRCNDDWRVIDPNERISAFIVHRLFLASFALSLKWHEDELLKSRYVARAGHIDDVAELAELELALWSFFKYDISDVGYGFPQTYRRILISGPDAAAVGLNIESIRLTAPKLTDDVGIDGRPTDKPSTGQPFVWRRSVDLLNRSRPIVDTKTDTKTVDTKTVDTKSTDNKRPPSASSGKRVLILPPLPIDRRDSVSDIQIIDAGNSRRGSIDETYATANGSRRGSVDETGQTANGSRRGSVDATTDGKPPLAPKATAINRKPPIGSTPHPLGAPAFGFGTGGSSNPGSAVTSPADKQLTGLAAAVDAARRRDLLLAATSTTTTTTMRLSKIPSTLSKPRLSSTVGTKPIPINMKPKIRPCRSQSFNEQLLSTKKVFRPWPETLTGIPPRRSCSWTVGAVQPKKPVVVVDHKPTNGLRRTVSYAVISKTAGATAITTMAPVRLVAFQKPPMPVLVVVDTPVKPPSSVRIEPTKPTFLKPPTPAAKLSAKATGRFCCFAAAGSSTPAGRSG